MTSSKITHDTLFRAMIAVPAILRALLLAFLPREALDLLGPDFELEALEGALVGRKGGKLQCDALLLARSKADPSVVMLILMEHKSRFDPDTALQLLKYTAAIWERERRAGRIPAGAVPRLFPFVFHCGGRPWPGAADALCQIPGAGRGEHFFPGYFYWLADLARLNLESFPSEPRLRSPLLAMRARHADEISDEMIDEIVSGNERKSDLEMIVIDYMIAVVKVPIEDIAMSLRKHGREYLEPVVGSALHTAMIEAKAEMLLLLLSQKFGELPEEAVARVKETSYDDLDTLAKNFVFAGSLGEVLENGSAR